MPSLSSLLAENIQPARGRWGWHGGPTPPGAVRGVSAKEAAWRAGPARKSIWDLALHIAYWNYAVRRRLDPSSEKGFPRSRSNWPPPPRTADEKIWRADVALLRAEHDRLVAVVRAIPPGRYHDPVGESRRWTVGELILGIAQHDAYHTGQIQLLKRLQRSRA